MPRPRVLCTLPLPPPFDDMVSDHADIEVMGSIPSQEDLARALRASQPVVLCPQVRDAITQDILDAGAPALKGVATYSVGVNHIDLDACRRAGVAVANTPGVLTDATADLTMALLLAVARRVVEGDGMMRAGKFAGWEPGFLLGRDLDGAQLGIIGFGRIGQAVARRAIAFGMKIATLERHGAADMPPELRAVTRVTGLDDLLASSDVVSLHCPLTAETRHLINDARLALMKPTAILLNTSRGPVVDEQALARALNAGTIWGAGLDVYEDEPRAHPDLLAAPRTVLLPHVGSATETTRSRMAELCAANTLAMLSGQPPRFVVP